MYTFAIKLFLLLLDIVVNVLFHTATLQHAAFFGIEQKRKLFSYMNVLSRFPRHVWGGRESQRKKDEKNMKNVFLINFHCGSMFL
jgi:hypothetical protein